MRLLSPATASTLILGLILCGVAPAQAVDEKHTRSDIARTVEGIASGLMVDSEISATEATSVEQTNEDTIVTVEAPSDFAELPMTLGTGSDTVSTQADDLVIEADELKTLVNPTDGGAQVVFHAETVEATRHMTMTFDSNIVDKAELGEGQIALDFENGTSIAVDKPWAYDSNNKALKTQYTIEGDTLRQVVETNADTKWPIVADPNWS